MKKYKLIKEFPGVEFWGVKISDIVEKSELKGNVSFYKNARIGVNSLEFMASSIESYPEFWEEVKEKEWEIVRLEQAELPGIGTMSKEIVEQYQKGEPTSLWRNLWKIHSIKRLSDGEVFTVGDNVNSGTISQFNIEKNNLEIFVKPNDQRPAIFEFDLSLLEKKIKMEPILKTEDGVNLYEGDECTAVNLKEFSMFIGLSVRPRKETLSPSNRYKYFKSEEKAKEWIEENEPKYSKKHMMSFGKFINVGHQTSFYDMCFKQWSEQPKVK